MLNMSNEKNNEMELTAFEKTMLGYALLYGSGEIDANEFEERVNATVKKYFKELGMNID